VFETEDDERLNYNPNSDQSLLQYPG